MCIMYMMPGPSSDGEFNTVSGWLLSAREGGSRVLCAIVVLGVPKITSFWPWLWFSSSCQLPALLPLLLLHAAFNADVCAMKHVCNLSINW
jgi:hypothetical protein